VPVSAKAAQTRARLLDAARDAFEENGFLASPVADIVGRAGVAHGTFYHYFRSREDILREIARQADERLNAPMGEVILRRNSDVAPARRIRDGVRAFLAVYRDQARIMSVIEEVARYDAELRDARHERLRTYIGELAASVRTLQRRGLADPALDPTMAAAVLGSITIRFPEMWLVDGVVDCGFDDAVEHIAKIFVNALGLGDEAR
jgi:AcrR family transcriptional regulator